MIKTVKMGTTPTLAVLFCILRRKYCFSVNSELVCEWVLISFYESGIPFKMLSVPRLRSIIFFLVKYALHLRFDCRADETRF